MDARSDVFSAGWAGRLVRVKQCAGTTKSFLAFILKTSAVTEVMNVFPTE